MTVRPQKKIKHLVYTSKLPSSQIWGRGSILIYDKIFERSAKLKKWIRKFPRRYPVKSGEKLKSIDQFPTHMKKVMKLAEGLPTHEITVVVLGGGSVGDFGGFVASVLKRGVKLVQIPSTWLAAMDSAHGGKTALNVAKVKNQVGTFYPASEIYLVKDVLENQPPERLDEALGEVIKISLLEGKKLWKAFQHVYHVDSKFLWKMLPAAIEAKYRIVRRDPCEKNGTRHLLNLGHTLGHVWESQLKIPHGVAVLYGVAFSVEWSLHRRILSSHEFYRIRLSEFGSLLPDRMQMEEILARTRDPKRFLLHDKKISANNKIRFVFLRGPGRPVIESVTLAELLTEMKRQSL